MSGYKNGVFVIELEPDGVCEYCGKVAETRPYGKNGARICFACGMANLKETTENFELVLRGAPADEKSQKDLVNRL